MLHPSPQQQAFALELLCSDPGHIAYGVFHDEGDTTPQGLDITFTRLYWHAQLGGGYPIYPDNSPEEDRVAAAILPHNLSVRLASLGIHRTPEQIFPPNFREAGHELDRETPEGTGDDTYPKYYLTDGDGPEEEVTRERFRLAEFGSGFRPPRGSPEDTLATAGFSGGNVSGRIEFSPPRQDAGRGEPATSGSPSSLVHVDEDPALRVDRGNGAAR